MSTWCRYPWRFPGMFPPPPSPSDPLDLPPLDLDGAIRTLWERINSLSRWYVICHPSLREHTKALCEQLPDVDIAVIGNRLVPPDKLYFLRDPRQALGTCPNTPPCPHSDLLHDVDDPSSRCCVDGCACAVPLIEPSILAR
jgi:hypothetical protein